MAQAQNSAHAVATATQEIENVSDSGRHERVHRFRHVQRRRARPHDERDGSRPQPAGDRSSASTSPTSCSATSIRSTRSIKIAGIPFRVVGVSEKKGSVFGNSQDNFAVIPLGAFQKLFGARQSLTLIGQAADAGRHATRRRTTRCWHCGCRGG